MFVAVPFLSIRRAILRRMVGGLTIHYAAMVRQHHRAVDGLSTLFAQNREQTFIDRYVSPPVVEVGAEAW